MSDDLSAFFAKKKDKKKKTAVKIEEVGQVLERRARRQEEIEPEIDDNLEKRDEEKVLNQEDSEWIEYADNNQGRLEGLKIKDMGLENESAEIDSEEQQDKDLHETKTWGQVNSLKKTSEEPEHAVTISDKQMAEAYMPPATRKYVPAHIKKQAPVNFDMQNDTLFPSLADASKIEKSKKDDVKQSVGWTMTKPAEKQALRDRQPNAAPTFRPSNIQEPKKPVYVPPSLRNRQ